MQSLKRIAIIGRSFFQRRDFRFADVDSDRHARPAPALAQFPQPFRDNVRAIVIESEPIDQRLLLGITKDARLRVSRLRLGCDRSDLDEAEAERFPRGKRDAIFIEAGGQADRVREINSENRFGFRWRLKSLSASSVQDRHGMRRATSRARNDAPFPDRAKRAAA